MIPSPLSTRRPAIRGLDIQVGAVIVLGMVVIASSLHAIITNPPPLNALLLAALGVVAGACAVKIPGLSVLVSASDTFFIASAMLAGPGAAMVAMALDSNLLQRRRKSGIGIRRLLFNATAPPLSLWAGTKVFQFLGGHAYATGASSETTTVIVPLVALTVVYFGLNSGLTAQAIAPEPLATAIEPKDGGTSDHIRRVQKVALGLAKALGVTDELTIKAIKAAALLHDTGKLAVPEHILNKPGKLTPAEFEQMKLHVDVGADILSSIDFPYPVVPIVRAHHENWDGSGYPRGIRGEEIPIGARILSVVDCYDALTSDRPYRPALS